MIKTFADRHTQQLYVTGKSKRFPPDIAKRAARKLEYLDLTTGLDDLRVPPGNRLHELERDRRGQHSIAVNSGYPSGLEGDAILPEARVLAVADVVEAMASHRPYRAALGIEAALEEIRSGAGTRYDAGAAAACQRVFRKGFVFTEA